MGGNLGVGIEWPLFYQIERWILEFLILEEKIGRGILILGGNLGVGNSFLYFPGK